MSQNSIIDEIYEKFSGENDYVLSGEDPLIESFFFQMSQNSIIDETYEKTSRENDHTLDIPFNSGLSPAESTYYQQSIDKYTQSDDFYNRQPLNTYCQFEAWQQPTRPENLQQGSSSPPNTYYMENAIPFEKEVSDIKLFDQNGQESPKAGINTYYIANAIPFEEEASDIKLFDQNGQEFPKARIDGPTSDKNIFIKAFHKQDKTKKTRRIRRTNLSMKIPFYLTYVDKNKNIQRSNEFLLFPKKRRCNKSFPK